MYIKQLTSTQFAGLKDLDLNFDKGLNVILGANESGKSTIINALFSVLFTSSSLKKNRSDDKGFLARYMPHPSGDFIEGSVLFSINELEYKLSRQWGNNHSISLKKPDGSMITVETDIDDLMQDIFELGPKTYQNIVFARQSQLKEMLHKLRERETMHSVNSLLREAVMNLDGVSVDGLQADIDGELEELLKRWDYDNKRPRDNKIFKTGVGKVLDSYYKKEKLRQEMQRVFNIEQELHNIGQQLHECESKNNIINLELKKLEPLEEDIIKRAVIEPRLNGLRKHSSELKAIAKQWPALETDYRNQASIGPDLLKQLEQTKAEENAHRSQKEKETLTKTLKTVEDNQQLLGKLNATRQGLVVISDEDIKKLEALNQSINTAATAMRAGRMLASVQKQADLEVWITRDLENETRLMESQISVNGYLKIRLGEMAEIEVKSGEFDFEQIKADYTRSQTAFVELLETLGVKDLDEARSIKNRLDEINHQIKSTQQLTARLLGGQKEEELKTRLQELGTIDSTRPLPVIQQERQAIENRIIKIKAGLITSHNKLQEWQEKYTNQAQLLDTIIDQEVEIRGLEEQLGKLQPLPPGIINAGEFRSHLKSLRDKLKQGETEYRQRWIDHDAKERELPEESYEEMKLQYEIAEQEFGKNQLRADKLLKIREVFTETLAEMGSDSLQPLADSFSRYLSSTTRGNYKVGLIEEDFDLGLIRYDEVRIPVNLLSSGTYDSVALALRFALLEHIFQAGQGWAVLDDCLVDLDSERRGEAVRIIREYAHENQVIFTTCSLETAQLLGGKTIRLSGEATKSLPSNAPIQAENES